MIEGFSVDGMSRRRSQRLEIHLGYCKLVQVVLFSALKAGQYSDVDNHPASATRNHDENQTGVLSLHPRIDTLHPFAPLTCSHVSHPSPTRTLYSGRARLGHIHHKRVQTLSLTWYGINLDDVGTRTSNIGIRAHGGGAGPGGASVGTAR